MILFRENINGKLKKELTTIPNFVENEIKELANEAKKAKRFWAIMNFVIAIVNLTTIALSSIILSELYKKSTSFGVAGFLFAWLVAGFTILIFLLTFLVTIYRNWMRANVFKEASQQIQFVTIQFIEQEGIFAKKNRNEIFHNKIRNIKQKAIKTKKNNIPWKKAFLKTLVGGNE